MNVAVVVFLLIRAVAGSEYCCPSTVTEDFGVGELKTTFWVVPVNIAAHPVNPNAATIAITGTNRRFTIRFIVVAGIGGCGGVSQPLFACLD